MKDTKLIYTDGKSGTVVIYDLKYEDSYCLLSGSAISSKGIFEIEVNPFEFNPLRDTDTLKKEINWREYKETPTSTLAAFNVLSEEYRALITPSNNEKIHHVEVTKPNGEIQTLITYDNMVETVVLGTVAAALCLGSLAISALILKFNYPRDNSHKLLIDFRLLPPRCKVKID